MSGSRNRRRRGAHDEEENADERWLLTYSDMITLLLALFIILWSVSSVNVSKFDELSASLRSAFSARVLPQNTSILSGHSSPLDLEGSPIKPIDPSRPQPAFKVESIAAELQRAAARQDTQNLQRIQLQIEAFARTHGFERRLRTAIDERGLVVQLLTDEILFDSGRATLKAPSLPLLAEIARLLVRGGIVNPVRVEGNTDNVPISAGAFKSNWELSTARAEAVLEFLLGHGVRPARLSLAGYADQRPISSNRTAAGRSLNRRVNLVVLRRPFGANQGSSTP